MSTTNAFDWLCNELERATEMDRLAARGTVRLALKEAGLDAAHATGEQMKVVAERVLPGELERRGIAGAAGICARLAAGVSALGGSAGKDSPEAVFARLGG